MILDLNSLFKGKTDSLPFSSELELGGGKQTPSTVFVEGVCTRNASHVIIKASVNGIYETECARCLAPVSAQVKFEMFKSVLNGAQAPDEQGYDDAFRAVSGRLDLKEVVLSEIYFHIDLAYLCGDGCRGICPQCGVDLNKEICRCDI